MSLRLLDNNSGLSIDARSTCVYDVRVEAARLPRFEAYAERLRGENATEESGRVPLPGPVVTVSGPSSASDSVWKERAGNTGGGGEEEEGVIWDQGRRINVEYRRALGDGKARQSDNLESIAGYQSSVRRLPLPTRCSVLGKIRRNTVEAGGCNSPRPCRYPAP